MPRNRISTTEHRSYSDDQLLSAVKQVSEEHKSARYFAKVTGIPRATLNRYVIKEFGLENVNFNPGSDHSKIFTMEQEILLANYIKHACLIHFGLKEAASLSEWMVTDLFSSVLKDFVEHERPTVANPKLIIMDNHESHLSIEALDFAKENGTILLTLPPHCSHKLQPLDVAAFRTFKKLYDAACNTWMINNPGKPITIYSIAGLVENGPASPHQPIASTSRNLDEELSSSGLPLVVDAVVSPEEIRPHPKAPPRKGARNIKKKRSAILTDTSTKML
ncbi:hypothetical protein ILUMI_07567 [Ignelater luminosus]|uniref:DDE-1 domain-containing protein n=1 Tax=Ignelater luminosus TaxID=2038154 RepID=A0A8K0D8J9_IGNLU|nr:hypothetical protein ILUMI_07567 [Ignelater luminosus]